MGFFLLGIDSIRIKQHVIIISYNVLYLLKTVKQYCFYCFNFFYNSNYLPAGKADFAENIVKIKYIEMDSIPIGKF